MNMYLYETKPDRTKSNQIFLISNSNQIEPNFLNSNSKSISTWHFSAKHRDTVLEWGSSKAVSAYKIAMKPEKILAADTEQSPTFVASFELLSVHRVGGGINTFKDFNSV